ncbi:UDP-N-acetylglucosamine 2-epimerase [Amycolatopsis thermoflava]|uniref:UDP-N-acetylglucosamine 2-epimerase n=1 Tax=Amycolatopsis thermoflava TaxID=84480 RepID=UPI00364C54BD
MGWNLLRSVCYFTGSRADYGPTRPIVRRLATDPDIHLSVIAGAGHLVTEQGGTLAELRADGLDVDREVHMVLAGGTAAAAGKSIGLGVLGVVDALTQLRPEVLLVAGDRYEALAAVVAAVSLPVVVAHYGGGQLTRGSLDDRIRHAMTKLAHLHFVLTEEDRVRVVGMGEDPENVITVGPVTVEDGELADLPDRVELENDLGVPLGSPLVVATYHPVTARPGETIPALRAILEALSELRDARVVLTAPNLDVGGDLVLAVLREYVSNSDGRAVLWPSLGHRRYLGLVRCADLVIGNSSSGLSEAPALGTPSVDVGSRQEGRAHPPSVVHSVGTVSEVREAIRRAMAMGKTAANRLCGGSPQLVVDEIRKRSFDGLILKTFHEGR